MKIRSLLIGISAFSAIAPAFAQITVVKDQLTVTGWATGSYDYTDTTPGGTTQTVNLDNALLQGTFTPATAKDVTAVMSVFYHPSSEGGVSPSGGELTLLDAYVSYNAGGGVTLTAGKFLSYLGYESFYSISDNMITLANQQLLGPIPGYHEGVKLDYAPDKTDTMGFAIADSEYQKPGYDATEGDGELQHNGGFEAYYENTAVNNLTIWLGTGYETKTQPGFDTDGVSVPGGNDVWVGDIWLTYTLDKAGDQIALEEIYKSGGTGNEGSDWLAYYLYNLPNTKISSWFCVSGEDVTGGASYTKYSISPTYTYNSSLSFRLQYSYTDYSSYVLKKANFAGAEVLFKF